MSAAGCASAPVDEEAAAPMPAAIGARGDARTLTRADLAGATQLSLLDYLRAERPQWLRGADGRPAPVTVYVDDAPIGGGAGALRDITLAAITTVRYLDVTAAQARYTSRVRTPVIAVSTR